MKKKKQHIVRQEYNKMFYEFCGSPPLPPKNIYSDVWVTRSWGRKSMGMDVFELLGKLLAEQPVA